MEFNFNRPKVGTTIVLLFLAAVVLAVVTSLLYGLLLMVLLSIVHEDVAAVPALGFWASWAVMFIVTIVAQAAKTSVNAS